jgi:hypothetical protein
MGGSPVHVEQRYFVAMAVQLATESSEVLLIRLEPA